MYIHVVACFHIIINASCDFSYPLPLCAVKEAIEACWWLKAAGFPQYVHLFEGKHVAKVLWCNMRWDYLHFRRAYAVVHTWAISVILSALSSQVRDSSVFLYLELYSYVYTVSYNWLVRYAFLDVIELSSVLIHIVHYIAMLLLWHIIIIMYNSFTHTHAMYMIFS